MIRIICGTCGTSQGYKTAADGLLALPASEEKRLVLRGVAEYETRPVIGSGAGDPVEGENGGGAGIDPSGGNIVPEGPENDEDTAELMEGVVETDENLDMIDGHFTTESLMKMARSEMEKMAADFGLDISKCKNKSEIAALLAAVEVRSDGDGVAPPELGAEAPVV